jgi:hypothetical protein
MGGVSCRCDLPCQQMRSEQGCQERLAGLLFLWQSAPTHHTHTAPTDKTIEKRIPGAIHLAAAAPDSRSAPRPPLRTDSVSTRADGWSFGRRRLARCRRRRVA